MNSYPLFLDLGGRRVLVVGAGPVAARRIGPLLAAGALVEVVAPEAVPALAELAITGRLRWHVRPFRPDDVAGAWLVHTATGDPAVDGAVVAAADAAGIWSVRASGVERGPRSTRA